MKRAIIILGLFGVVGAALAAAEIGKPAPEFTATDINGQTHKLSDYLGKIVVLESYNLDCPYCRNHYKSGAMQELQRDLAAKGVVWLLVNSVSPKHPSHRSAEAAKKEWASEKINATAWLDDSSGALEGGQDGVWGYQIEDQRGGIGIPWINQNQRHPRASEAVQFSRNGGRLARVIGQ